MSFFTNKHVITAFIITPVLAMAGYYATDLVVKEKPQNAVAGQSYPLLAQSNCRYTSGECDLVNEDFKSNLVVVDENGEQMLSLTSSHSLQGVSVGFTDVTQAVDSSDVPPSSMKSVSEDMKSWRIDMPMQATDKTKILIAMRSNGSNYYAETTMGFTKYETTFKQDFKND